MRKELEIFWSGGLAGDVETIGANAHNEKRPSYQALHSITVSTGDDDIHCFLP